MQDYEADVPALKLPLPAGIDVILGVDWAVQNNVDIMFSQKQINFVATGTGQPHVIPIPDHLKDDAFRVLLDICCKMW